MICYFNLVHFTFSISYSVLPFHLVYVFQFLHLFFLMFFLKSLLTIYIHTHTYFPGGSDSKASVYNAGDPDSIPGLGRSLEKEMASQSTILVWRLTMERRDLKESHTTERLTLLQFHSSE